MKIIDPATRVQECVAIWNSYVDSGDVVFKPLTEEKFNKMFVADNGYNNVSHALEDEKGVCAFGFANYATDAIGAYISYIGVRKDVARQGLGAQVLKALEEKLSKKLDSITTANWEMLPLHVEFQGAHVISAE